MDFPTLRDTLAVEGGLLLVDVLQEMIDGKACTRSWFICSLSYIMGHCRLYRGLKIDPGRLRGIGFWVAYVHFIHLNPCPRAPFITGADSLISFPEMTAESVVRRHRAISHQVSHCSRHTESHAQHLRFQKPLFAFLLTGRTLQLHAPSVYADPPAMLLERLTEPGMMLLDPATKALAVRCAGDSILRVDQVQLFRT